jgi:hypothetical protein
MPAARGHNLSRPDPVKYTRDKPYFWTNGYLSLEILAVSGNDIRTRVLKGGEN